MCLGIISRLFTKILFISWQIFNFLYFETGFEVCSLRLHPYVALDDQELHVPLPTKRWDQRLTAHHAKIKILGQLSAITSDYRHTISYSHFYHVWCVCMWALYTCACMCAHGNMRWMSAISLDGSPIYRVRAPGTPALSQETGYRQIVIII